MLERLYLSASEQTAAVVDQLVVESLEHVDVDFGKVKLQQFDQSLICFIKNPALTRLNDIPLNTMFFLLLFITEVIGCSDLGEVIHIFCTELHFSKTSRMIIIKSDME